MEAREREGDREGGREGGRERGGKERDIEFNSRREHIGGRKKLFFFRLLTNPFMQSLKHTIVGKKYFIILNSQ